MLASLDKIFIHRLNTNIDKDTCELALGIIRGVCALPAQVAVATNRVAELRVCGFGAFWRIFNEFVQ